MTSTYDSTNQQASHSHSVEYLDRMWGQYQREMIEEAGRLNMHPAEFQAMIEESRREYLEMRAEALARQ